MAREFDSENTRSYSRFVMLVYRRQGISVREGGSGHPRRTGRTTALGEGRLLDGLLDTGVWQVREDGKRRCVAVWHGGTVRRHILRGLSPIALLLLCLLNVTHYLKSLDTCRVTSAASEPHHESTRVRRGGYVPSSSWATSPTCLEPCPITHPVVGRQCACCRSEASNNLPASASFVQPPNSRRTAGKLLPCSGSATHGCTRGLRSERTSLAPRPPRRQQTAITK